MWLYVMVVDGWVMATLSFIVENVHDAEVIEGVSICVDWCNLWLKTSFSEIIVEGDSLSIINALNAETMNNDPIGRIINDTKVKAMTIRDCSF